MDSPLLYVDLAVALLGLVVLWAEYREARPTYHDDLPEAQEPPRASETPYIRAVAADGGQGVFVSVRQRTTRPPRQKTT